MWTDGKSAEITNSFRVSWPSWLRYVVLVTALAGVGCSTGGTGSGDRGIQSTGDAGGSGGADDGGAGGTAGTDGTPGTDGGGWSCDETTAGCACVNYPGGQSACTKTYSCCYTIVSSSSGITECVCVNQTGTNTCPQLAMLGNGSTASKCPP